MTGSVGGGQDRLTRVFAKVWEKHLGVPIRIKPVPGASGRVGLDYFAAHGTNGSLLASVNLSTVSIMHRQQNPNWDWSATIHNLGVFGVDPGALFVPRDSPYKTVQDVVDAARLRPMLAGVSQWSNSDNLVLHQLMDQAGARLHPIPAGGGSATVTAILGGHVPVAIGKVSNIKSAGDAVRIIGVTMDRNPVPHLTDDAPVINDVLGIKVSASASYRAIVVPAGMPVEQPELYRTLKDSFEAAKDDQEYIERAAKNNISSELILDLDHDALQAVVEGYWKAFDDSGAFFSVDPKATTVKTVLLDIVENGEMVVYSRAGQDRTIKISRTNTSVEIGGSVTTRDQLKPGMACEISWIGLDIGATSIKCR